MSYALRCSLFRKDSNTWLYWCFKWSNVGGKKNCSDKCKPLFGQTAFNSFSTRFICTIVRKYRYGLSCVGSPSLFSHSHYSAIRKDLDSKYYSGEAISKVNDIFFEKIEVIQPYIFEPWGQPNQNIEPFCSKLVIYLTQNPPKNNWFTQHNIGKRVG